MKAVLAAELRIFVVLGAMILSALAGVRIGAHSTAEAQAVTPAPWLSVAGPFSFCYRYPETTGCAPAEDKRGDPFVHGYKVDIDRGRADCLHWSAVGDIPAALLTRDPLCTGGTYLNGGIYWFDTPNLVIPLPVSPPPPASVTSGATATSTSTVASGATSTPSPPTPTKTKTPAPADTPVAIPTLSPAQKRAFTVYCDLGGGPYKMIVWGSYGLTYSVPDEWCETARAGAQELLRRMAETTPAVVEVRP